MDIDTSGNIAVGGTSYSSNIAAGTSQPNPFVVFFNSNGSQRWYYSFDRKYETIDSITFNPDGTRLLIISAVGGENFFSIVNPAISYQAIGTYEILDGTSKILYQTFPGSVLFTTDAIYFSGAVDDGGKKRFKVTKIDLTRIVKWEYELDISDVGQAPAITLGDSSDLYIGGWQQNGGGSNEDKYIYVARFLTTQGSLTASSVWLREAHQGKVTPYSYIRYLRLTNTPTKKLVGCIEYGLATTGPFGIIEITLNGSNSPLAITTYEHSIANEVMSCTGFYLKDSTEFYAYVSLRTSKVQKYAKIISGTQTIQYYTLPIPSGTMTHSIFVSLTQSYYIGSLSSITAFTPTKTFATKTAYLMTFDITASCLTYTYAWSTATTMTNMGLSFTRTSTNEKPSIGLTIGTKTIAIETQGANTVYPNWCTYQRTISIPTLSDNTYYVNDPTKTITVPNFTLDTVCSDEAWTYQYDYMNPTATPTFPSMITNTGLVYNVQTNNYLHAGTYQMRIIGTLPNTQTQTRLFNIIIAIDCDKTIITQGTITSTQTYQITQGSAMVLGSTSSWTQNIPSPQCPSISFVLTKQSDGSPADSIFSFNGNNIEINTNNYLKVGTYNLNLVGNVGASIRTIPFTVNVGNPCASATISTTAVTSITYYTTLVAQTRTIAAFTQNSGVAACNSFTYFATYADSTALDTSTFTFNPTTLVFSVSTSNVAKVGIYSIMITGYIFDPNKKNTLTFQVDIKDNCLNVIFTTPPDKIITYSQKDPALTISGFNFLENIGTCGSFTYSLTKLDDTAYDSTIFSFNSATPSIQVQTNNVAHINTYLLKLKATLGSWGSTFCTVTVNIIRGCADSIITTSTLSAQTYQVTDPIYSFTFNDFSSSVTPCGAFTYTAFDFSSGSEVALNSNFISFDSATKTFNVQTSNPLLIGSYTIKVKGQLAAGAQASNTFLLNIVNPCAASVIQAPTLTNQVYYVYGSDLNYMLPIFTQNLPHSTCSQFTYTLTNSDSSALDINLFTFNSITRNLHVSTTDISKIAQYTLKYSAYLLQPIIIQTKTFIIDVVHVCTTVVLNKAADQTITYEVKASQLSIINLGFTENLGVCGPITYTLSNSDNTVYDSIFNFDQVTPQIQIQTNNIAKIRMYSLKLTGTLGLWRSAFTTITVNVILGCIDTTITPNVIAAQTYLVTNPVKTITFTQWTSSIANCGTFTYSATISSSPLDSSYITFDQALRRFSVSTSNPLHINTYTVTIVGTLPSGASQSTSFTLIIKNPCETSTITPPSIQTQIVYALGSALTLTLPVFTQSLIHLTCYQFTYELTNTDGSVLDPTLFTFNPTTRLLTASTSDPNKIGLYTLKCVGYLLQKGIVQGSTTFQVDVKHVCNIVNIQPSATQTIGYILKDPTLTISSLAFTNDLGVCGPFTYTLSNQDNTPYDNSVFTFDSNIPSIMVQTNNVAQIGNKVLKIKGTLGAWGSASQLITVQIVYGCQDSTLTPSNILDQTYYVTDSSLSITFNEWTSSVVSCGGFTYTATIGGLGLDSNYISLNSVTRTFTVQTNNYNYIGTYNVNLIGSLISGATNQKIFQLKILNPCTNSIITPPSIITQIYYVLGGVDLNLVLPIFQQDLVHASCSQFTYLLTKSDGTAIDSTVFTFTALTRNLKVSSNDIGKIGLHNLKYTGYLIEPSVTNSVIFTVQLRHFCETTIITPALSQTLEYRQKNPAIVISSLTFTDSIGTCGTMTYSLQNQDNTVYDSSIFTFDPLTPKITVQTNSVSKIATYNLKLIGSLGSFTQAFTIITVNIVRGCADTIITPSTILDQTYFITNPEKQITFVDWTSSVSLCGSFTYSATNNDGTALDSSYISFDGSTKTFKVQTSNIGKVGIYTIKIRGTLVDGATSTNTFILSLKNPCANAVISSPVVTTIKYYVFGTDLNQILPQFQQNIVNPACYTMTYSLTNLDGTPINPAIFTFTPSSRNLFVSTSDITQIRVHTFKYSVYILEPKINSSINIQVQILHVCNIVFITPPIARSVLYAVNNPAQIISSLQSTEDQGGLCGTFTYSLSNSDNTPYDTSIFTFNSLAPSITVFTSNLAKIRSYPLKLTATLSTWGSSSSTITVNVVNGCAISVLTPTTISDQTYYLTDAALTFSFLDWQSSITGCGSFSYSANIQGRASLDPSFINLNLITKTFTVQTSNVSHKGTYVIELTGRLIDGATATIIFALNIINPCQFAVITSSAPVDQVFTIPTQTTLDYLIPAFTSNIAHPACSMFTYVLENANGSPIDSTIFTFTMGTLNLNIATSDVNKLGTYNFKLRGYLFDQSIQGITTFKVQIKHECQLVLINASPNQNLIYYNKDPALVITGLAFTENIGLCGQFTYQLQRSNGSPFDSQVFSFYPSTPIITVSTNSIAKTGVYNLKLIATLGIWGSAQTTIQVIIYKACNEATITPYPLTTFMYRIHDPTMFISFLEWGADIPGCGSFTYTVTDPMNQQLDSSVINYASATKTFAVQSSDMSRQDEVIKVKIIGTLGSYISYNQIFEVKLVCLVDSLQLSFNMNDYVYSIGDGKVTLQAPKIFSVPNCGYDIFQNARLNEQGELKPLPDFIEYDRNKYVIGTKNEENVSNTPYRIRITYWLTDPIGKKEAYYEWNLSIKNYYNLLDNENYAPYFEQPLETILMKPNSKQIYNFPLPLDLNNDQVTMKLECSQIKNFGSCSNSQVLLEPVNVDVGTYFIYVELKDNNVPPAITTTQLQITIIPEIIPQKEEETVTEPNEDDVKEGTNFVLSEIAQCLVTQERLNKIKQGLGQSHSIIIAMSFCLSAGFLVLSLYVTSSIFLAYYLKNYQNINFSEQKFIRYFFTDLKLHNNDSFLYTGIFTLKRLVFAIIIFYMKENYLLQIYIQIILSLAMMFILLKLLPFQQMYLNGQEIFNEVCYLTLNYLTLLLTNQNEDKIFKDKIGWVYIGVFVLNYIINLIISMITLVMKVVVCVIKYQKRKISLKVIDESNIKTNLEDKDPIPHKISFEPGIILEDIDENDVKYFEFFPGTNQKFLEKSGDMINTVQVEKQMNIHQNPHFDQSLKLRNHKFYKNSVVVHSSMLEKNFQDQSQKFQSSECDISAIHIND